MIVTPTRVVQWTDTWASYTPLHEQGTPTPEPRPQAQPDPIAEVAGRIVTRLDENGWIGADPHAEQVRTSIEPILREQKKAREADPSKVCGNCGGPYIYDTSVPSAVWNAVIRTKGMSEYLCAACILGEFGSWHYVDIPVVESDLRLRS